uniref:Uncharacterized protein MANES_03G123200 n=1 Tax=Rhizophora mucronata TaxID=61149 RepID=A0A2P2MZ88_RHIMU
MSDNGKSCVCCCQFVITLGLTALFVWLSLRTTGPKCSLQLFYIPALNQTLNAPENTTLFFKLRLQNTNDEKGVYYDPVNVTFFDSPNRSHSIGNYTIPKFYQGHKKKATKPGQFQTSGLDRQAVVHEISVKRWAVFRVDMATSVRYKILLWKTKRHTIKVGADVHVNNQGTQDPKKGVKLKSNAAKIGSWSGKMGLLMFNFSALILLSLW